MHWMTWQAISARSYPSDPDTRPALPLINSNAPDERDGGVLPLTHSDAPNKLERGGGVGEDPIKLERGGGVLPLRSSTGPDILERGVCVGGSCKFCCECDCDGGICMGEDGVSLDIAVGWMRLAWPPPPPPPPPPPTPAHGEETAGAAGDGGPNANPPPLPGDCDIICVGATRLGAFAAEPQPPGDAAAAAATAGGAAGGATSIAAGVTLFAGLAVFTLPPALVDPRGG